METKNSEIFVKLPDTPEALGNWVSYEVNNVVSVAEFMHCLQMELDKTDLMVENIKHVESNDRFQAFIVFKLPNNLALSFYKKAIFDGNTITLQLHELIEMDDGDYQPRWIFQTNVNCPHIEPWEHRKFQGMGSPTPVKYQKAVDTLMMCIDKVVDEHKVEKIDM